MNIENIKSDYCKKFKLPRKLKKMLKKELTNSYLKEMDKNSMFKKHPEIFY